MVRVYVLAEGLATSAAELATAYGVTAARLELMYLLGQRGPLIQREIAYHLDCTPRQVTAFVDGLSTSGHVERATPENDRRRKVVRLTALGEEVVDEITAARSEMAHDMFKDLAPGDVQAFERVLEHVIGVLGFRKTVEPASEMQA